MRARHTNRKTAPRVRDGVVLKKNNWAWTRDGNAALLAGAGGIAYEERAPGAGRRHVVSVLDVQRFFRILPDAATHLAGLRAVVLGDDEDALGLYDGRGIITLCSWSDDLIVQWTTEFVKDHAATLARLGVPLDPAGDDEVTVYFDERSARAFQLVHILLHELGHHRQRMRRRNLEEDFAESWAFEMEERIWPRYKEWFAR